jgi:hypothetical protein
VGFALEESPPGHKERCLSKSTFIQERRHNLAEYEVKTVV